MSKLLVKDIRVTGIFGHGSVGKTSIVENILFNSGQNSRIGSVDAGTSICDFDDEEKERKISISSSVVHYEQEGVRVHLIDTPGYADFLGEVISTLYAVDSAIISVCGVSGVEVRTTMIFDRARNRNIPVAFFVNKLDKENSDFIKVVENLEEEFGKQCVPIFIPIGKEADFKEVVSLIDPEGRDKLKTDENKMLFDEYRSKLMDAAAETDDELIEKYLEGEELTHEEIVRGISKGIKNGTLFPILCGSAEKNIGIKELMHFIAEELPSPVDIGDISGFDSIKKNKEATRKPDETAPFSAYVFKSIADPFIGQLTFFRILSGTLTSDSSFYNINTREKEKCGHLSYMLGKQTKDIKEAVPGDIVVVAKLKNTHVGNTLCKEKADFYRLEAKYPSAVAFSAISPKTKADEDKLGDALHRMEEEDPTFHAIRNKETKELVVSGMGDLHLDILMHKMSLKFHVEVDLREPRIAYKETIKGKASSMHKHKKQSGGRGQYGHVVINMFKLPRGEQFSFIDSIVGGSIPKQYIPAVEKGVLEVMEKGVIAGYPVCDVSVELYDGSFHNVDSSELAFKIAGSMAFKKAFMDAKPILLEPIMKVEITVPNEFMGDITGNLNSKRGRILGMEPRGKMQVVIAEVPQVEMAKYVGELRSMTSGRGTYSMNFTHYEEVPEHLSKAIIAEANKEEELVTK